MAAIVGLIEVVLVVEDIARSVAFYRDVLGLEVISPPEVPVKFLRVGAERSGIPQQIAPAGASQSRRCVTRAFGGSSSVVLVADMQP